MSKFQSVSVSLTEEMVLWINRQDRDFNFSALVRQLLEPEMRKIQVKKRIVGRHQD